ncbi:MAG: hypothetical protein K6T75_10490 [Acetobacteraceae bacterium]|nr:hypothetical protein [Acetobacteraceae bacterium]
MTVQRFRPARGTEDWEGRAGGPQPLSGAVSGRPALRPGSRPAAARAQRLALALWLALAVLGTCAPGCSPRRAPETSPPPAGPPAPPEPPRPPKIIAVRTEPVYPRVGGFYTVEPGRLRVIVEAVSADWVGFGISPTGTEQQPVPAGEAARIPGGTGPQGGELWSFTWDVPDGDLLMHLTITARSPAGECSEVIGLYHEAAAGPGAEAPPGGREPFYLLSASAGRFSARALAGLPKYFVARSWLDDRRLLGATGTNPIVVDVDSGAWRALNVNAWWFVPDPAGERIAYANEGGLYVTSTAQSGDPGALLAAAGSGGPPGGVLWSPDGAHLLYWYTGEWDLDLYVIDASGGEPRPVEPTPEGYFLTEPAAWTGPGTIVFNSRASRSRAGEQEYRSAGYRGDIVVCDLETGGLRFLSQNPDGTYWNAVLALPDGRLVFSIEEPGRPLAGLGILAPDGTVEMLECDAGTEAVSFAPDGRRWLERCRVEPAPQPGTGGASGEPPSAAVRFLLCEGGAPQPWAAASYTDVLAGPLWSPSSQRLAVSLACSRASDSGWQLTYHTWVIEERQ